jgi:sterol desaturase/sphingolipid hydroxylase (fatty acid hydroxylase superfamily)
MPPMPAALTAAAQLGAGLFAFTFLEYAHHRWGGHTRALGRRLLASHREHHRDPIEGGVSYPTKLRQRAPLVGGLSLVFALALAPALGLGGAGFVVAGLLAGYLYSEWFHHRMHHAAPRGPVGRYLWRHHYVHHFVDATKNYGFTSPLWDLLLFTYRSEAELTLPARLLCASWPEGVPGFHVRGRRDEAGRGHERAC